LVAKGVIDAGFKKLDFDEDELVIEAFELAEEAVDEGKSFVVAVLCHVQSYEAGFEVLAQEVALLRCGPLDAGFCGFDLKREGVRD